jgi:monoamine oxidase
MSTDFDAIVVGAGFAGVTATRELEARGHRTLLLEARDRLGGRTWSDTFAGSSIELGGTWVHWLQPHIWSEITRYDIPIVEDDPPQRYILASGSGLGSFEPDEVFERQQALYERFFEGALEFLDRPFDPLFREDAIGELDTLSIKDRLDRLGIHGEDRGWLDGLFSMVAGGPTSDGAFTMLARWWSLSGWSYALMWDILSRYRLKGGTIGLLEAMLGDGQAELRLSTPVAAIADGGDEVQVTTRDGERFTAAAAVVAVPANVWPTIDFTPELTAGRAEAAARGIGVPHAAKVWVHVRGEIGRVFAQLPEGHPMTIMLTYTELDDSQLLVCFSGNPSFDAADLGQIEAAVQDVLPEAEVLGIRGHDWVADEFSLGGWSFLRPGQLTQSLRALQEPQGRLAFAGADVASGWSGYIDGAVESGLRAARQVAA